MYEDLMKPDEDWTGLANIAERRRLQNRIAQRAYRRNMRERAAEVDRLRERIRELERTTPEGAMFDAIANHSSSTPLNTLDAFREELGSSETGREGNSVTEYTSIGYTNCSEQEASIPRIFSSVLTVGHDTSTQADFASFPHTDLTLVSPWIPERQTTSTSQGQLPSMSDTTSGQDEYQNDSGTNLLSPPSSPSQGHQPTIRVEEATLSIDAQDRLPTGNVIMNGENRTQSVAMSIVDINTLHWPGIGNEPAQDYSIIPNPSLSLPELGSGKSSVSPSQGHASVLHLAVASGSADTLRFLLQKLEVPTAHRDASGYTPLERAVLSGRADLVAILLEHDNNVQAIRRLSD